MKRGQWELADRLCESILKAQPLDTEFRLLAARARGAIGDVGASRRLAAYANRILNSIFQSGDGKTPQTAFVVIDTREEYAILREAALIVRQQTLREHSGSQYDVLEAVDGETGQEHSIWFNIDLPKTRLDEKLEEVRSLRPRPSSDSVGRRTAPPPQH